MSYQDYQDPYGEEEEICPQTHQSYSNYDDAYYADEIGRGAAAFPTYEPEDIKEYEDEVPYYEDDPIYNSGQVQYNAHPSQFSPPRYPPPGEILPIYVDVADTSKAPQPSFRTASSHHSQRQSTQYQPPFGQHQHQPNFRAPAPLIRGSNPRNSSGIRLRPVSELPDMYRGIFKFGVFNAVQSSCFDTVFQSDENMVISGNMNLPVHVSDLNNGPAPTGSGKTVIFELAIIRMLKQAKETGELVKCVYMAPTKALCSERQRDWTSKFDALGIKCCELTGDTVQFGKGAWDDAKGATIIITTGEKWDSLTRNWTSHGQILSQIQLFLVDETRGSAVRFVLVSATVPNIQDLAHWIGNKRHDDAATVFEFGEEFRPCKLTRHVVGVPRQRNDNDFSFTRKLDFKLFGALQTHSIGKPILVFVSTRKGVHVTAEQLQKDYAEAERMKQSLPWSHPKRQGYSIDHIFHEKNLTNLAAFGIGVHHAGLTIDDRRAVEDLYLKGLLRVVGRYFSAFCLIGPFSSCNNLFQTLAVGVNLPAHTVVIKGVQIFQNNMSVEYSDLDVMQMLGRAGRPQFDKDGIAIILCETELENKYRELVQGKTIIGLGTITNVRSAKEWLRSSFLFQRIQKNPAHYALGKGDNQSWEERVDDMVMQSVEKLRETKLIAGATPGDTSGVLTSTEFGDIMSKFYIRQSTMGLILALPERPTLRDILEIISTSEELSEIKLRSSEKTLYNKLRKHNDIRFEVKKVEKTSDKVFLLIQAVLGGISLNSQEYKSSDSQPQLEAFSVFKHIPRIARVIVEVAIVKKRGTQLKYGLELVRCLTAKAWEDRPVVLRQIESIGEKSLKVLAENGITSLPLLRKQQPYRIETVISHPFPCSATKVLASVNDLPQYTLSIKEIEVHSNGGKDPVEVELSVTCGLVAEPSNGSKGKKARGRTLMTAILTLTSDLEMVDFRRIPTKALKDEKTFEITAELTKPSQSVVVYITSESVAGVTITETYKPKVAYREYPTRVTRPPTAIDLDLDGLEDDPEFWNMNVDEHGDEMPPPPPVVRDLTKAQGKKALKGQPSKSSVDNAVENNSPPKPKKLSNGNYKIRPSAVTCAVAMGWPSPQNRLKSAQDRRATPKLEPPSGASPIQPRKPKKKDAQSDPTMQNLERLHERTNVSLKLPEGGRLKLEPSSEIKRKQRPALDFSVELTQLGDGEPAVSYTVADLNDDDDDLPEPHELLKTARSLTTKRESSPETTYSDSIDSLIRNVPECDLTKNLVKTTAAAPSKPRKQQDTNNGAHKPLPFTPLPSRKRSPSLEAVVPPPKRPRFDAMSRQGFSSSPAGPFGAHKVSDGSEDQLPADVFEAHGEVYEEDDDFVLDCDILPTTPALTFPDDGSKATTVPRSILKSPQNAPVVPCEGGLKGTLNIEMDEQDDDLNELDAWLNSGAVEIVYTLSSVFMNAAQGSSGAPRSGLKTILGYTGIPPSWLDKRPKLPSRNWLIFISVTSSVAGLYIYDRQQCKAIRRRYIDKVKDLAEEPVASLYRPRKVTVYGGKWPGDEDHDQTLKYFRKYVKPILVAAAVDYVMIGGKRLGDIANRVAEDIKTQRRLEAGLESRPEIYKELPTYQTLDEQRRSELDGGIVIIGRPTFKEFMAGLKRGWTEPINKVDTDELLAQELENDGRFDEEDDDPLAVEPPALSTNTTPLPPIPPLPPLLLVPFTDLLGFTKIPLMIWDFFNRRHDVRAGAEAGYKLVMSQTRPFSPPPDAPEPLFSDITSSSPSGSTSDVDFDVECETYFRKSLSKLPAENDKARAKYYGELKTKLETARALARGTREPTKDEVQNPPPTEVELRAERLKKEKRWRGDLQGWQIIAPTSKVAWDSRFRDALSVFVDPPPGSD
ncbi:inner membrane protein import complex subunit Tim54-domain-containing protein [Mycena galericulata]|nr:inner membrane protein import complex subunit Tim54-domain-containing protein [Mycena galericulata]